jgi:translation initiation factor IF-2
MNIQNKNITERPPIVAIMGHIDHGKSTLLAYIRKSTKPLNEAGGITQHISAYEVEHISSEGKKQTITFLDTPGHEAFNGIRKRGASVADVAVLVVSAEDGVKPQTIEALHSIRDSKTPFIVAINKIDKPDANIERTKQSLAENEVYVEGYGGDVPVVAISAKTGEGVPELLDMIILVAELEELSGDPGLAGTGFVLESNRDVQKGISATCIIKNGTIEKGMFVVSGTASAPVRMIENYLGKPLQNASLSRPVKIIGWDEMPTVGNTFTTYANQKEARDEVLSTKESKNNLVKKIKTEDPDSTVNTVLVIVKADTGSSLEAVNSEIGKLTTEKTTTHIISSGIGSISENDVRLADGSKKAIIIGFHTKVDPLAKSLAERTDVEIKMFDIIYKMTEWLKDALVLRTPKQKVDESTGLAKILKIFSKTKDKQIVGGKVEQGSIKLGAQVKIMRRDAEIGIGKVKELQVQKVKSSEVAEGKEFGALIEAKIEIAAGDKIESFITIER